MTPSTRYSSGRVWKGSTRASERALARVRAHITFSRVDLGQCSTAGQRHCHR